MPKVAFRTLGCRLNQADTDSIAEDLLALGFEIVPETDGPDVIIVNSCTVTKEATRGSRKSATRAAADHPDALVVMAGCYPVADPKGASSVPGVSMTAGNDDKGELAALIAKRFGLATAANGQGLIPLGRPRGFPGADRTRVNLKVQTGCDEFCSFCIIPFTRGPLRSDDLQTVIDTAKRKVDAGARELVLTGVHLGKYGWDQGRPDDALVELLEALLAIDGLSRIRMSSILSRHLSQRVVDLIATEDKLCRFLHVPLQAGHDDVLERMNRPYRIADYMEAIYRVIEAVSEVAISTDVIVGFPGETASQFEATLEVVEKVGYMKLHVFRYSAREGTPSAAWPDQVPEAEKRRRSRELIALGADLRLRFHEVQLGRVLEILVEGSSASGELVGHSDNFVKVRFSGPPEAIDRLVMVKVTEAGVEAVRGEYLCQVAWADSRPRAVHAAILRDPAGRS